MSSTGQIQPSDAGIKALAAEIQRVPSKSARSIFQAMLSLIRTSADSSPVELLRECVSRATLTEAVEKINASETTDSKIIEIFDLKFNTGTEWVLAEDSLAEVPTILRRNLHDLHYALYDTHSEATCRIAVDIMLIQCQKYLRDKYQSAEPNTSVPSPPPKAAANTQPLKHVKLFPEASISIEMCNESVPNSKVLVTGRADWALGYGTAGDEGTLLIAMEAKQRSEFSKGETQLIAYLAILRENRLRMRKTNVVTQGFYSDGSRFAFICITADGTIERSLIFDIEYEKGLKTVFNFIVTMMDTAMKSTPNATPTKPGPLREKEVNHFQDEVWLKVYAQIDEAMEICQMEDAEWTKRSKDDGEDEAIEGDDKVQGVKEAKEAEEAEEADPKPASRRWYHPLTRSHERPDHVFTFRFPVPLTEEQCNISGSITTADQWAPQVWTKAKRAHVLMNEMMELHVMPRLGVANTETLIGYMKLDQNLDLSAGPRIVEVIAVSTSTFSRWPEVKGVRAIVDDEQLALLDTELLDNGYRIHRCYNVIMIEWVDGRAKRRGIGRIRQSVWEDSKLIALEEIEVTLV